MANAQGEVAMITGATAGVGRAVVREFAKRKASIGLIARGEERLRPAKQEVEAEGGQALALPLDVANADEVERAAQRVENELGPIDVWVNNAMTTIFAPFSEIRPAEYKSATEVTYLGCMYGTKAALKRMLARDRGVHLPAMNTPQFSWCRTRLPWHPQPVPPIFEPEVAARAIYWATHHRRREVFVGAPTVKAIYGQNVLPGLADHYLGRTGYDSQQTSEPVAPDRPNSLFEPVPGDYAAHGIFTERSKNFSLQTWADLHRTPLTIAAGFARAGAWIIKTARRRR